MYPGEFEYFAARSVTEAIELLTRFGDEARILAGGQSLLPMMKLRIAGPRYLIDINRVEGLGDLRHEADRLVIGALCRHAHLAASSFVRERVPLMWDAANVTADVQVRNRGTVAGSVAHADPSGDWPAALMALETEVSIAGTAGPRRVPLREFITDAYTTDLGAGEMVTGLSVRVPPQPGGAYVKFEKRAGDFAAASVGVQLEMDGDSCHAVAISLGALGATPIRVMEAERLLQGRSASPDLLTEAEGLVREAAQPFEDTRGSVEYKRHLAGVLFRRAFELALARAGGQAADTLHL